jgi:hypothetical protein
VSLLTYVGKYYSPDGAGGAAVEVDDAPGAFEEGDDSDFDIVLVDQEKKEKVESAPVVVAAPVPASDDAVTAQAAQSKALIDGLGALGEKLGQVRPVNVPSQVQGESEEDFNKRIEEELYKPGGAAKALREATQRQLGPLVAGFQQEILETKKALLMHDPDLGAYYKRFKEEVDRRVEAIPRNQWHGEIYRQVLKDVLIEKQPTIQAETIADQVKKGIEEGLRAAGIDPAKGKPLPAPAMQTLGSKGVAPQEPTVVKREKLEVTSQDVNDMIRRGIITSKDDLKAGSPYIESVKVYIARKKGR